MVSLVRRSRSRRDYPFVFRGPSMSEPRSQTPAPSVTGRRRRFTGAHPYPALPKSRLPLLRGVLWVTWAAVAAVFDAARSLIGMRRSTTKAEVDAREPAAVARPPRVPSLTPTG
jgi:hypothetical protein